ncbi:MULTISPECIES: hypothetical protein [Streptomyces]|uniref:hypothetical protein n=1 Tax=Streptomyces TaxID=1883 RepID=UPI0035ABA180
MSSTTQSYAYVHASAVRETPAGRSLALETSGGATPAGEVSNPRFFDGFLTAPAAAATALLAVADVAASRYYRPRPSAFLDPVVTAGGDRLRLESFSACCGVHARQGLGSRDLGGNRLPRCCPDCCTATAPATGSVTPHQVRKGPRPAGPAGRACRACRGVCGAVRRSRGA